jgi:hypothetical protein
MTRVLEHRAELNVLTAEQRSARTAVWNAAENHSAVSATTTT